MGWTYSPNPCQGEEHAHAALEKAIKKEAKAEHKVRPLNAS